MKKYVKKVLLFCLFIGVVNKAHSQIFVNASATGSNNGDSWSNAYIYLQDGLANASSGDEIWIAAGTYYPDEGGGKTDNSRTAYFTLVNGVSLYGGFSGSETSKCQASPMQNVTILSGDIDKDGVLDGDNSYHVLYTSGLSTVVTINGITIEGGYANGSSDFERGGGLFNYETEDYLTISNCIFDNNYAGARGGGAVNDVGYDASLSTTYLNCIFKNNTGKNGGAVHNYGRDNAGDCAPQFINCLFYENTGTTSGGGMFSWAGSNGTTNPVLTNCTFYNNTSSSGDAFRSSNYAHSYLTNCIIWSNDDDEFTNSSTGNTTITNCIVNLSSYPSNTIDNGNNLNSDPLFEDAVNADFRLQKMSPAINAGTNHADLDGSGSKTDTIGNIAQDLQGRPRIDEDYYSVDMGVYESVLCECNHSDGTNAGSNITTGVGNTIYGEEAGASLTTGSYNSLMGYQAGYNLITADSSTFIGAQAGFNTITASKNIFLGKQAGYSNTTGYNNIFAGNEAGYNNTTGYNNIAIGEQAGNLLSSGFNNILIGENVSNSPIMTGNDNILIGSDIGNCTTCSYNVTVGGEGDLYVSGENLSTGSYNTLFGAGAGGGLSTGSWNTFIGKDAGAYTEYVGYNTFVGASAGWENNRTNSTTNARYNTYVGDNCGYTNREGEYNVGFGANADFESTNLSYCTFLGYNARFNQKNLTLIGTNAYSNGQYSVGIGYETYINKEGAIGIGYQSYLNGQYGISIGYQDTILANYGIAIGYQANVENQYGMAIGNGAISSNEYSIALGSNASATGYNSTAIGYGASVSGHHEIVLGNASTTTIGGSVDYTALSDGRYKRNIQEDVIGLDFIRQLRPVTYRLAVDGQRWMDARSSLDGNDALGQSSNRYSGFIAQEVEQAAQNTNFNFSGIDYRENIDKYGLRYAEFVVPLVKAIQELHPKIENQEQTIQQQQNDLKAYHEELKTLLKELSGE